MRLNKFIATRTLHSRRAADTLIQQKRVKINGMIAPPGAIVGNTDQVELDGQVLTPDNPTTCTIILNKPVGYVCSREGQGSPTVYDLLPDEYKILNYVGRLDKNSSGLLLFTNNGELAHSLTHPSYSKEKCYEIRLDNPLAKRDEAIIMGEGVALSDGPSRLKLEMSEADRRHILVKMSEGRNRQIRRTFAALGYDITKLHRISFGDYTVQGIHLGEFRIVD